MGRVPEIYIAAQMTLSYPAGDSYDQDPGSGRVCCVLCPVSSALRLKWQTRGSSVFSYQGARRDIVESRSTLRNLQSMQSAPSSPSEIVTMPHSPFPSPGQGSAQSFGALKTAREK